ncbi:MAG: glycosyltransferase family 2 protein [Paraglaciecola sp.]|nr:glycosyltransferase family 2 protein [Paraglaciecola sp.]NCT46685.1 glycosyltransferase family 2 protein [Paraglaciecola sp.]
MEMTLKSPIWLSILIPVYNVEAYLRQCLNSVLTQAKVGVEIIVVDDCSTDDSLLILESIANQAWFPVTVLKHGKNAGLSAARNTLLHAAQGRYVWFLDSDDYLMEGAIAHLHNIVSLHSPDIVLCDYQVIYPQKTRKKVSFRGPTARLFTDKELFFQGLFRRKKLHIWSKISKRSLWADTLSFPVGRLMEDIVVTPRLGLRAESYFYQPSCWVAYRKRPNSILATYTRQRLEDTACALEGVLTLWQHHLPELSDKSRLFFSEFAFELLVGNMRDGRRHKLLSHKEQLKFYTLFHQQINWSKKKLSAVYWQHWHILQWLRFSYKYFMQSRSV